MKTFKEFLNERLSSVQASKKTQDPELSRYVHNLNYDKVEELLSSGVDPDSKPNSRGDKEYALHEACYIPDLRMLELLVSYGADVNIKSIADGYTPLMCALRTEDKGDEVIEYLLHHGADINATDLDGNTILKNIAYYGISPVMFEYLLSKVDLEQENKVGRTAFLMQYGKVVLNML